MARWRFLAFLAPFTALCLLFQAWIGAWDADLGLTSDEAAHYINSLLLLDYLREAFPANPMTFARAYYAHLPRVSVGHWPPAFYAVQAAVSAVAGRSTAVAVGFQGVIAGATAAAAATLVRDRAGLAAGVAAGLVVLAAPSLLFDMDAVMLDTALSLLVLCSALWWARFSQRRDALSAAAFALCASAAILTKGNGFGLALLPLCHAAISRDARPLRTPWAWGAAALVAVLTLPWHVATFGMQASGFNYAFGPDYTGRALPFYAGAAVREFGAVGVAGFLLGLLRVARGGRTRRWPRSRAAPWQAWCSRLPRPRTWRPAT